MKKQYDIKRFWCPLEGRINLQGESFLSDPEAEYSEYFPSDVVNFNKIKNIPCLILLGEPGIGKSTVFEKIVEDISSSSNPEKLIYLNLRTYYETNDLKEDLFNHQNFKNWLQASKKDDFYIFLDSLDEYKLQIPNISAFFENNFNRVKEEIDFSKLYLRIVCRTLDWSDTQLGKYLKTQWGEENYKEYELAPLRKEDVTTICEQENVNSQQFINAVIQKNIASFAIKPLTLLFLVEQFKQKQQLSLKRSNLYYWGCLCLAQENNLDRKTDLAKLGGKGELNEEERLKFAAFFASIMLFSNKAIITKEHSINTTQEEITVVELTKLHSELSENKVLEVLNTGLFNSRGTNKFGFAHQHYAEYLASYYLLQQKLPLEKLLRLFQQSIQNKKYLIPQLREVAAWIATENIEFFKKIIQNNPEMILYVDTNSFSKEIKEENVSIFLNAVENSQIDLWSISKHYYHKLNHANLTQQLKEWIINKDKKLSRDIAIKIARECKLASLQQDLFTLAADSKEKITIRVSAVYALDTIAEKNIKKQLINIISQSLDEDIKDELKGQILRILWPKYLPTQELFKTLTLPKRKNFIGNYYYFLYIELIKHLSSIRDIQIALQWLASEKGCSFYNEIGSNSLIKKIIILAWKNLNEQQIVEELAKVFMGCKKYRHLFLGESQENFNDVDKRYKLAQTIIKQFYSEKLTDIEQVLFFMTPKLLRSDDFLWCAEQLEKNIQQPTEVIWAQILMYFYNYNDISQRELIDKLREKSEILKEHLQLDSEIAKQTKQVYKERKEEEILKPDQYINFHLDKIEEGAIENWNLLTDFLVKNNFYEDNFIIDITQLPIWPNLKSSTQENIILAAQKVIQHYVVYKEKSSDLGQISDKYYYKINTFILLYQQKHELNNFPQEVLKDISSILFQVFWKETELRDELIQDFYQQASKYFLNSLNEFIILQINNEYMKLDIIEKIFDEKIADLLVELLPKTNTKPDKWEYLLEYLFKHKYEKAGNLAEEKFEQSLVANCLEREFILNAGLLLLTYQPQQSWQMVWKKIDQDEDLQKQFYLKLADKNG